MNSVITGETESPSKTCLTDNYKPEVLEEVQLRFAGHILSTNQIDNLVWAKEFMDAYERKRGLLNERKHI